MCAHALTIKGAWGKNNIKKSVIYAIIWPEEAVPDKKRGYETIDANFDHDTDWQSW